MSWADFKVSVAILVDSLAGPFFFLYHESEVLKSSQDPRLSSKWHKLRRVGDMGWNELQTRARQELNKQLDISMHRAGLLSRVEGGSRRPSASSQFFFSGNDVPRLARLLREHLPDEVEKIMSDADDICVHRFRLLGYEALDYGPEIDWHLDAVHGKKAPLKPWYKVPFMDFLIVGDHKVTWELNRHQHLVTLAKAWALSQKEHYVTELVRQWYAWRDANPFAMGINWASSLEVSLRSLSWLWVYFLLSGCSAVPADFETDLLSALALNGNFIERYLSTYFSPNTHLIGEAVGLLFIGILCPRLRGAERWRSRGWNILLREAEHQVTVDGVHFEQALHYHVYALDLFLHARTLAARNQLDIPGTFDGTIKRMLEVLRVLSQAGPAHTFGDDDGGRLFNPQRNRNEHLSDPLVLGATLFGQSDLIGAASCTEEAIWLFGKLALGVCAASPDPPKLKPACFEDAGIYVLASEPGAQQLVMDAGSLGIGTAGHAHADGLSVTVSFAGRQWLVDSGTCCYMGPTDERDAFRGTRAHNTVVVDGLDQAVPDGPFSWRSIPEVKVEEWISGETCSLLTARHNGFSRLDDPVVHRRSVFHVHGCFWLIQDFLDGRERHNAEILWHFASDVSLTRKQRTFIASFPQADGNSRLAILTTHDSSWSCHSDWANISPAYGKKERAPLIRVIGHLQLPAESATLIVPLIHSSEAPGKLERLNEAGSQLVHGYKYVSHNTADFIFIATGGAPWVLGPWSSDAKIIYFKLEDGTLTSFVLCAGSFVRVAGTTGLSSPRRIERFEWLHNREGTSGKVFTSDEAAITSFFPEVIRSHGLGSYSNEQPQCAESLES